MRVDRVDDGPDGTLLVHTDADTWQTRALVNATGTWDRPFLPSYPGRETFLGRQLHTVDYDGPDSFRSQRVVVVGGGASAVQILGELAPVASTTWVTRRPPVWRDVGFDSEAGRAAVALVEERVRRGLPPQSVVSVTGLILRPQEQRAAELGAYERHPMFARIEPDGVRWADGGFAPADAIIWATGFRPSLTHLAPLRLREDVGRDPADRPRGRAHARPPPPATTGSSSWATARPRPPSAPTAPAGWPRCRCCAPSPTLRPRPRWPSFASAAGPRGRPSARRRTRRRAAAPTPR